jgi:hypothetical protein
MPWGTLESIPTEYVTRAINIPDDPRWESIVMGALYELTLPHNFQEIGVLSPEQMAARFMQMWEEFIMPLNLPVSLSEVSEASTTTTEQTFQAKEATQLIILDANGDPILTLDEATKGAEFTGKVGVKPQALDHSGRDADPYYGHILRVVGDNPEGVTGVNAQNVATDGYTEFTAYADEGGDFDPVASASFGVGGSTTPAPYTKAAYLFADPDTLSILIQAARSGSQIRFDVGGYNNERVRIDAGVSGATPLLLLDVSAGTIKRVSIGASNSGGTGFKVLRVPN